MNQKKWGGLFFLVLLIGCIAPETPTLPINNEKKEGLFQDYARAQNLTYEEATQTIQDVYGIREEEDVFAKLPPKPSTFENDKEKWKEGNTQRMGDVAYETYIQPDFYPHFDRWKENWINNPTTPFSAVGLAAVPADQEAIFGEETVEFESTLFVGTSWGVTENQGIGLTYHVTPDAPIHVTFEPQNILLGKTFPLFENDWIHKIRIHGTIDGRLSEDVYTITILTKHPDSEAIHAWEQVDRNILIGGGGIGPSGGLATLTLVREK